MLARRLELEHRIVCVTDDAAGLDAAIEAIPIPARHSDSPRCRRRMRQFDREWISTIGDRILAIDLDVVLVGDITPLIDRPDPLVCWRVGYAGVFSGSIVLMDAGVLDPLWRAFDADPDGYPRRAWPGGVGSDQAMLNFYLSRPRRRSGRPCGRRPTGSLPFSARDTRSSSTWARPGHPNLPAWRADRRARVRRSRGARAEGSHYPWVSEWR
jgi:hypothetical protein